MVLWYSVIVKREKPSESTRRGTLLVVWVNDNCLWVRTYIEIIRPRNDRIEVWSVIDSFDDVVSIAASYAVKAASARVVGPSVSVF
jgi:hypothetical protein